MADVIGGLFGMNPYQIQQQQYAQDEARAAQMAQMGAAQRGVQGLMQGGAGLARLGAGMMGMQNPEVEQAAVGQELMKDADTSTPQGMMALAKRFNDAGLTKQAMVLANNARTAQAELQKNVLAERKQSFQEGESFELRREQAMEALRVREEDSKRRSEDNRLAIEQRREAAREANAARLEMARLMADARKQVGEGKPMPPQAVKLQDEYLDSIAAASRIKADMGATVNNIESGKLNLNWYSNLANKTKNAVSLSSEESRNYASFLATLQKLRNDSLRLNKGTQTEGDAQRAWEELLNNLSDSRLVKQRLTEIGGYNNKAESENVKKLKILRDNYKQSGLDISEFTDRQSPLGSTNAPKRIKFDASGNMVQ